jgi:hypothetical protein
MQVRGRIRPPRARAAASPAVTPDPTGRRSWKPRLIEWGAVFGGSFVLATVITWPLLKRIKSGMYGFGNDNYAGAWQAEWIHDAAWGPERIGFTERLQAPFGMEFEDRFVQPLDRILAILFGEIGDGLFALNLQIFLSFVIAGPTMYLLARYLTGSRPAAAVAAVIFMASPFHLAMAMQYQALSTIQWHPLLVLAFLVALQTRRYRDAVLFGAAFALIWFSSYYYGWFAVWFLLAMLVAAGIAGLVRAARGRRTFAAVRNGAAFVATRGSVAAGTFLLLAAPMIAPLAFRVASDTADYSRSAEDLYHNAVKPWQYVLPPHDNPIFGRFTRDFIQTHLGILPVYEQSVYLGLVAVVLAVLALVAWSHLRPEGRLAAPMLAAGAVFMIVLALGSELPVNPFSVRAWMDRASVPNITNVSVYVFDLLPTFRYYGRTFAWTSVALAGLAAMGFAVLAGRLARRSRYLPWAAAAVAIGLVLVEFANSPPFRWLDLTKPAWARAIQELPDRGPVVNYPLQDFYGPRSAYYIFAQGQHDRPTLNPAADADGKELSFSVGDPDNPEAGRRLHEAGFGYAVVHTNLVPPQTFPPYQPPYPDDSLSPNAGAQNPWFDRVRILDDAVIYRIRSEPRAAKPVAAASYGSGFGVEESDGLERWRWMHGSASTLPIYISGPPRAFWLSFRVTSFYRPRSLTVSVDGKRIRRLRVPPNVLTNVTVPLLLGPGAHDVHLAAKPGEEVVNDVLHNGDLRQVSLRVSPPTIRETGSGTVAAFGAGFGASGDFYGPQRRWIVGDTGTLTLTVAGKRRPLALSFEAESLGKPRRLAVSLDGRVVSTADVPGRAPRDIVVPLELGPGAHAIRLHASPDAVVADSVLGNGDPRKLSVRIDNPVVEEAGGKPLVSFGDGFWAEEDDGVRITRWMKGRQATFDLHVRDRQRALLRFGALAFRKPRTLHVNLDGRRLRAVTVPSRGFTRVAIPVELAPGRHTIRLDTPSRPFPIASALRNNDRRAVTVRIERPSLVHPRTGSSVGAGAGQPATIGFGPGFSFLEQDGQGSWRWLTGDEGTFRIRATGERRRYLLGFAAGSLTEVRLLRVTVDGKEVLNTPVPANRAQDFRVPLELSPGEHVVGLSVRPGAQRIQDVIKDSPDRRTVSIRVRTPTLEPDQGPRGALVFTAYGYGFAAPVPDDPPGWRWLSGDEGTLNVAVTGRPRPVRVSFSAQSFSDRPRRLTVRLGGRTIASRVVPSNRSVPFTVRVPARVGTSSLQLRSEPGAVFHGERPFHPDPRKVSIRISTPVGRDAAVSSR